MQLSAPADKTVAYACVCVCVPATERELIHNEVQEQERKKNMRAHSASYSGQNNDINNKRAKCWE